MAPTDNPAVKDQMPTSITHKNTGAISHRFGFTLAEILAVITLIALIAGMGSGLYMRSYQKRLVEKSAAELLQAALYARIVAVERNQPCKMYLDTQNNGFYLTMDLVSEDGVLLEEQVIKNMYHRPVQMPESMMFENIAIRPNWITSEMSDYSEVSAFENIIYFAPNGTADEALVQIGNGIKHYTLSISPATGRPKLILGTVEQVTPDTFDLDELWMSTGDILQLRLP